MKVARPVFLLSCLVIAIALVVLASLYIWAYFSSNDCAFWLTSFIPFIAERTMLGEEYTPSCHEPIAQVFTFALYSLCVAAAAALLCLTATLGAPIPEED